MTVIAVKDGIVAADSASFNDGYIRVTNSARKVHRITEGHDKGGVVAGTGLAWWTREFARWAASGMQGDAPVIADPEEKGTGILLLPHSLAVGGVRIYAQDGTWTDAWMPYSSYGAGRDFTLGAMAQGASAIEAVELALKHVAFSGGPVQWMKMEG